MNIEYSRQAVKAIGRQDRPTKQRIRAGVEGIPDGDIKPLQGTDGKQRLRIGDWRIIFSYRDNDTLYIEKIAPRGEIYKGV